MKHGWPEWTYSDGVLIKTEQERLLERGCFLEIAANLQYSISYTQYELQLQPSLASWFF